MPAPTVEERDKILKGMGAGPALAPYETDQILDEVEGKEPEVEASEVGEEVETEEVEAEAGEEQEVEAAEETPEELLARVSQASRAEPEQSENDRLRAELAETRKALEDRISAAEASVAGQTEEPEETSFKGVRWQEVLTEAGLDEDTARAVAPMFGGLAKQMEDSYQSKFKALEGKLQGVNQQSEKAGKLELLRRNLQEGLSQAQELGGLEAAVVGQFAKDGNKSFLARKLTENPSAALTPGGVVEAVHSIARQVELAGQTISRKSEASETDKTTTTSARGKGKATSSPARKKLSPEDEIKQAILGTKSKLSGLPFMLD